MIMGRGAAERDILFGFRAWVVGDENIADERIEDDEAGTAMSVSESGCIPGV